MVILGTFWNVNIQSLHLIKKTAIKKIEGSKIVGLHDSHFEHYLGYKYLTYWQLLTPYLPILDM